jgi:hypothetical protein
MVGGLLHSKDMYIKGINIPSGGTRRWLKDHLFNDKPME